MAILDVDIAILGVDTADLRRQEKGAGYKGGIDRAVLGVDIAVLGVDIAVLGVGLAIHVERT